MRIVRKTLAIGLSVAAFIFMVPFEFMQGMVKRLAGRSSAGEIKLISEAYADVFYMIDEALKVLLPDAQDIKEEVRALTDEQKKTIQEKAKVEFDPEFDKEFHFYISKTGAAVLDTVHGKWGPIKFMLAFDAAGNIKDLAVLELKERRGRPVKERRFLDQFVGKSIADPIKLNKDIRGIAGATISSRQMTNGIKKLVYIYEELYRK